MSRPDEGLIHQWLDGECTPEESAALERLVATDPAWAAAVAEARGLMAASSRIVKALDAVPHALPQVASPVEPTAGSPAEPWGTRRTRRRAPRRWLGLAATLALVAGTAYVLRERSTTPFVPAATVAADIDDSAPGAPPAQPTDPRAIVPPSDIPPIGVARTAERVRGATERTAGALEPVPSVRDPLVASAQASPTAPAAAPMTPPVAAPTIAPSASLPPAAPPVGSGTVVAKETRSAEELAAAQRREAEAVRGRAVSDAPRGAVTRRATLAAPVPAAPPALPRLDGCWRVAAPPELIGTLESPEIRRTAGDTLVLVTARGDVSVVRAGGVLRGGLEARQVPCGAQE